MLRYLSRPFAAWLVPAALFGCSPSAPPPEETTPADPTDTEPTDTDPTDTDPTRPDSATGADCASATLASGVFTMMDQGVSRTYRVHVPAGYDPEVPAPLVVLFHGWGGDEDEFLGSQAVTGLADARGYVLVAPRGLGSGAPDRSYNSWSFAGSTTGLAPDGSEVCDSAITPDYRYPSCMDAVNPVAQSACSWTQCQADDVAFTRALIAQVQADGCIDPARVFAVGGSNGGMFTWELGQQTVGEPLFRAIAPLIGLPHRGYLSANGELPALLLTGTEDPVVPPGAWEDPSPTTSTSGKDRYDYTGATGITRSWAEAHGCDVSVDAAPFEDADPDTDCRSYCGVGAGGAPPVVDCRVDMGHTYGLSWTWPLILDFFDAWSD